MDGHEAAAAWEEWKKTTEAEQCLDGQTSGVFLHNRLWRAFMAGIKAAEQSKRS